MCRERTRFFIPKPPSSATTTTMLLKYSQDRKQGKATDVVRVGLLDLPTELLIEVLKYLRHHDLLRCQEVCRTLHDLVRDCVELQYIIELAADNLVDGSRKPGSPSTAERLQLLLDRRRRWRELDWTQKVVVPIPGQCQAYELVGGTFAKSMSTTNAESWAGPRHLNVTWLPTRDTPAHSIIRNDLGIPTRDFAIDPSQDLIALVEMDHGPMTLLKIHIRTISTNKQHPQAAKPCLIAPVPFTIGTCFIQIVQDVVGMFFWLHEPSLLVWNWRTAEVLVLCTAIDLPRGTWDFAFLSNRAYLVTSIGGNGSLELYTFGPDCFPVASPRHAVTLRLPEIKQGRAVINISTHSAPFLGGDATENVPFTASQDDRIHVMTITYGERHQRFHLFVKNSFLLSLITDKKRTLEWDEWGPENTRFFEHSTQFQWLRYVHGQRVVLPPAPPRPDTERMMCVLDFNVHPKRVRDPSAASPAAPRDHVYGYQVSADPTKAEAGTLFRRDVYTKLPYAVSHRNGIGFYTGFMIDDQRIIGMKESALAEGNFKDIDVFTF